MTGMVLNLLVNIVMAGLLAVTISYCWMLNRRIKILQDSRSELSQLLKHFDESTQRASESIVALQTASKKIGETIQARIDKANYLLDDLSFLIEKGGKIVDKLEADMAVTRARSRVQAEATGDEELPPGPQEPPPVADPALREKTRASLEAMLNRISGRAKPAAWPQAERPAETPAPSARSRSEQELMNLLKAGLKG